MRKTWLGLASMLVGGGAIHAQDYPPIVGEPIGSVPYSIVAPQEAPGREAPGRASARPTATMAQGSQTYEPGMPALLPAPKDEAAASSVFPAEVYAGRDRDRRFYLVGDFVAAWTKKAPLSAPLLTVGNLADIDHPGAIGQPSTGVLFGGDGLQYGTLTGFRAEGGIWLGGDGLYSVDFGGLVLSPSSVRYSAASTPMGDPLLARPVVNADTGQNGAFQISTPGSVAGSADITSHSDFWGLELNMRRHAYWYESMHAQAMLGLRTLSLRESIDIQNNLTDLNGGFLAFRGANLNAGDRLTEQDLFRTRNQFYGMQVGGAITIERQFFDINLISKLGVGTTDQETIINGVTTLTSPGLGNATAPGGINAQVTNIGTRHRNVFGLVPEFGLNLGMQLTKNVRLQTGYSFLFWNNVVRPGSLIDPVVNPGLPPGTNAGDFGLPGPSRPAYTTQESTYYLHMFNIGLDIRF